MIRRPPRSTRTDTRFPDTRSSDLRGGESRREQGKWLVRYRMTGRDIEEQGLARRPSRNENDPVRTARKRIGERSEEHTSELQSLMRISYAVFCWKKKKTTRRTRVRKLITTNEHYYETKEVTY